MTTMTPEARNEYYGIDGGALNAVIDAGALPMMQVDGGSDPLSAGTADAGRAANDAGKPMNDAGSKPGMVRP